MGEKWGEGRVAHRTCIGIASAALITVMVATVYDVAGRPFGITFPGSSFELGEYLTTFAVCASIIYTELVDGHVKIGFLVDRFSGSKLLIVRLIVTSLCFALCAWAIWPILDIGIYSLQRGEIYYELGWPVGISKLVMCLVVIVFALLLGFRLHALFKQLLRKETRAVDKRVAN